MAEVEGPALAAWLRAQGAGEDLAAAAEPFGPDVAAFWASCRRADWLLALAAWAGTPSPELARAARSVVGLALDLLPDGDEAARAFDDDLDEVERSQRAEQLEGRAAATADGAVRTLCLALACALRAGTLPEAAPLAAALTTQALVLDAGECAMASVVGWSQQAGADRVRAVLASPRLA